MTDAKPRTRFIPCIPDPTQPELDTQREYCGLLVIDTDPMRSYHRAWHANEKKVKEALRDAVKDAKAAIADRDRTIADLAARIDAMARDVENIDIPEPIDPIEIAIGGWSDADEPDDDPEGDDAAESAYAAEDVGATLTAVPRLDMYGNPLADAGVIPLNVVPVLPA
jgi:hypothetical protein